jgi:hypothetical protein
VVAGKNAREYKYSVPSARPAMPQLEMHILASLDVKHVPDGA